MNFNSNANTSKSDLENMQKKLFEAKKEMNFLNSEIHNV